MAIGELLSFVMQGGAIVLLALVLIGLFLLVKPAMAEAKTFLSGLVLEQRATREVLAGLAAEQRAGFDRLAAEQRAGFDRLDQRMTLAEERIGAVVARSATEVADVVRERASDVEDRIAGEQKRGPASSSASCGDRQAATPRCAA